MRPVVRMASVRVSRRATDPTASRGVAFGVAMDWDYKVHLLRHDFPYLTVRIVYYRTMRYGNASRESREKGLREAAEVWVVEELDAYVVEKSGSRRSSVERREEKTFYGLAAHTDTIKVPRAFMERLTDAVCYAA